MHVASRHAAIVTVGALVFAAGMTAVSAQPTATHSRVTLRAEKRSVQAGSADRLYGKLTPGGHGRSVTLQRYGSAGWHQINATHTKNAGAYQFQFVVRRPGPVKLRVYAPATPHAPSVTSPSLRLVGLRWHYLSAMQPLRGHPHDTGTVHIDAKAYPHSVQLSSYQSTPVATYDLRGSCRRIRATLGLDDNSDPAAAATLVMSADGHQVVDSQFTVGEHSGINKSVKGRSRLRLALHAPRNPVSYGDFATARVLCSF